MSATGTLGRALDLAQKGWYVIPAGPDKRPLLPGWPTAATTDENTIRLWWATYPDALVGVVPGRSGHTVIDIDMHEGRASGFDSAVMGKAPTESRVQGTSMSGKGRHLWYLGASRTCQNVNGLQSIDVRSIGGYVVVTYDLPRAIDVTEALPAVYYAAPYDRQDGPAIDAGEVQDWLDAHGGPMSEHLERYVAETADPFRGRDYMNKRVVHVVKAGAEGQSGAATALQALADRWMNARHKEDERDSRRQFENSLHSAIAEFGEDEGPWEVEIILPDGRREEDPVDEPNQESTEPLFIDLETLDDAEVIEATIGIREDKAGLMYAGAVNALIGDPEEGKSLAATALAVHTARAGGTVVWMDLDHNGAKGFRGRLQDLGGGDLLGRIRFAQPDDRDGVAAVVKWVVENAPEMFVVDSIGELLPMFGASPDSADDYTRIHRAVLTSAARVGSAVVVIDHLAKGNDSRAYGSTGTIAKKRAIDGAMYRVDATKKFVPGKGGEATLRLLKDRHGSIRSRADEGREPIFARFTIDGAAWGFFMPMQKTDPVERDVVHLALLDPPPVSQADVRRRLKWGAERVKKAWDRWSSD